MVTSAWAKIAVMRTTELCKTSEFKEKNQVSEAKHVKGAEVSDKESRVKEVRN